VPKNAVCGPMPHASLLFLKLYHDVARPDTAWVPEAVNVVTDEAFGISFIAYKIFIFNILLLLFFSSYISFFRREVAPL
jgi:hypothetical protein